MELYIIRHAQSINNSLTDPQHRVCDPPLTELGLRQARTLAKHLASGVSLSPWEAEDRSRRGCGITRLFCSPMWRSLQTAQPIGQALGLAPEVWIEIHEYGGIYLDHGGTQGIAGYPGKTRSEILAEFPNYRLPQGITEQGWWQGGHETQPAFHERVARVAGDLRTGANGVERIALITHGNFADSLIKALLNQPLSAPCYYHHLNTAISRIDFGGDGHLDIQYLNRVGHLPLQLIS